MQDHLEEPSFTVTLSPADMFLLYDSVKTKLESWAGGHPEAVSYTHLTLPTMWYV